MSPLNSEKKTRLGLWLVLKRRHPCVAFVWTEEALLPTFVLSLSSASSHFAQYQNNSVPRRENVILAPPSNFQRVQYQLLSSISRMCVLGVIPAKLGKLQSTYPDNKK